MTDMVALKDGIQSADAIVRLAEAGVIRPETPFASDQVQPASLDLQARPPGLSRPRQLPAGPQPYGPDRLDAAELPRDRPRARAPSWRPAASISPSCRRAWRLPEDLSAAANPKSSTGRIDVFTRVITDRSQEFDTIEAGYQGPLYAEISPRTFPVLVRTGTRLSQLRLRKGEVRLSDAELHGAPRSASGS